MTENDWKWWKNFECEEFAENSILITADAVAEDKRQNIASAKKMELSKWMEESVYDEVPNQGQECQSTTWVITEKWLTESP